MSPCITLFDVFQYCLGAGAPQKIMWLFEEHMRAIGVRDRTSIEFWVPGEAMFGVKKYADVKYSNQS